METEVVATILGRQVLTSKPGSVVICGSLLTFEDGSWVDVESGEMLNLGDEPINLVTVETRQDPQMQVSTLYTDNVDAFRAFLRL